MTLDAHGSILRPSFGLPGVGEGLETMGMARPGGRGSLVPLDLIGAIATAAMLASCGPAAWGQEAPAHKRVTLEVRGDLLELTTTAETVAEALAEWGFELGAFDRVFPPAEALVTDGAYITYEPRGELPPDERVPLPFVTTFELEEGLPLGARCLVQEGRPGSARLVGDAYEVLAEPQERAISVGLGGEATGTGYWSGCPVLVMSATAYYPGPEDLGPGATGYAASGIKAHYGVVAVDRTVIPLGTMLYIEDYGYAVAGDVGGAIKGNKIDLCFDEYAAAVRFGRQTVTVYVLE